MMRALLAPARADPRAASSSRASGCPSCRWSSGWASRARRCASRSPRSSTRACCAASPPAATSCASSRRPTSRRDRAARRARGHGRSLRRRARAPAAATCARCARSTSTIEPLVHRADYESFERYVDAQRALPRAPAEDGAQPAARARARRGPVAAVRRARARSFSSRPSCPSRARSWSSPTAITWGWSRRSSTAQGARAESLAREHARLSLTNLEIVLSHRGVLEQLPGASLLALDAELEPA